MAMKCAKCGGMHKTEDHMKMGKMAKGAEGDKGDRVPKAKGSGDLKTMPVAKRERMGDKNLTKEGTPNNPKAPKENAMAGGKMMKVIHEHHHYHHKAGSHSMAVPEKKM